MPRTSRRRGKAKQDNDNNNNEEEEAPPAVAAGGRQLPAHIRNRQRAIAEREAARLARPERRKTATLGHADRKKSAVTSTPFGILASSSRGGDKAAQDTSWCGPFTVARQMIAAREDAKRKREEEEEEEDNKNKMHHPLDAVMEAVEEEKRQKAHPSLLWKSRCVTPETSATKNKKKPRLPPSKLEQSQNKVPSLYQLCVDFVVDNFDQVESLGQVGHDIRTSIAHTLASQNRLDGISLSALVEPGMESLELVDCADIPQEALCESLHKAPTLRYLKLDQSGRCFGKTTVETLLNPYQKHATEERPVPLFALHVGGAYLLRDSDAAKLVGAMAPTLQSLALKACPLLGLELCKSIPETYQKNTLLELSLEDMTLKRESWEALIGKKADETTPGWQRNLKSLALKRMTNLQDDLVIDLLKGAPDLEHVDLSDNHELTDASLSALRTHERSHLRSLHLCNLKQLTNVGLETLFTQGLEGMGPPPQLKVLHLNHLDVEAVTDAVMELVLQSACRKPMAGTDIGATNSPVAGGLSLLGGMVRVELQGAAVTDSTLEQLAATSANTLEHLNVSFCPHVSNKGLGYLVDTVHHQLEGVQIWGCAQITEEFWNGHSRAVVVEGNKARSSSDGAVFVPLQITGAWMKKSGISSIRS